MAKILVAEDDPALAKLIRDWLLLDNHAVEVTDDGADAFNRLKVYDYDLLVLDWQLPNMTGVQIIREYRARGGVTPVLMLTGRNTAEDKEEGLDSGADDYLTKPFHGKELNARLRALLRRPAVMTSNVLKFADLVLDRANYSVKRGGRTVDLVPTEFDLLEFLMRNPHRVFSQDALLSQVWPNDSDATGSAVTTCIKRLRKKLDEEGKPDLIKTVHGVGYKLAE